MRSTVESDGHYAEEKAARAAAISRYTPRPHTLPSHHTLNPPGSVAELHAELYFITHFKLNLLCNYHSAHFTPDPELR